MSLQTFKISRGSNTYLFPVDNVPALNTQGNVLNVIIHVKAHIAIDGVLELES